jgi:hypothetical protein
MFDLKKNLPELGTMNWSLWVPQLNSPCTPATCHHPWNEGLKTRRSGGIQEMSRERPMMPVEEAGLYPEDVTQCNSYVLAPDTFLLGAYLFLTGALALMRTLAIGKPKTPEGTGRSERQRSFQELAHMEDEGRTPSLDLLLMKI